MRDDTPYLLYKEQEEKWVPIRVLKDMSVDSDKEYDLDYIRSCKQIHYFKRTRMGILLFPSLVGNVNFQLLLLTEHVLGLNRLSHFLI